MSEVLRARIAAIIRQDLAEEAAGGFPLLQRFPNSETASVPGHFTNLSPSDREILLTSTLTGTDPLVLIFADPRSAQARVAAKGHPRSP